MKASRMLPFLFLLGLSQLAWGQIPRTISYQGVLRDATSGDLLDGVYSLEFRLYDAAAAGTQLWGETQPSITVSAGVFNAVLGSVTAIGLAFDQKYWLEIWVGAQALSPRIPLESAPYSLAAESVVGTGNVFPSSGNVGIGTTTPGVKLDVAGTLNVLGDGLFTSPSFPGSYIQMAVATRHSNLYMSTDWGMGRSWRFIAGDLTAENFSLFDNTAGQTRFLINSLGNMGIGTTTPTTALDVSGTVTATSFAGDGSLLTGLTASPWVTSGSNVYYNSGNVGIATTTPAYKLHVADSSGTYAAYFKNAGGPPSFTPNGIWVSALGGYGGTGAFIESNGGSFGTAVYGVRANVSTIDTGPGYAVYADASGTGTGTNYAFYGANGLGYFAGNVGIGTTSPGSRLTLEDSQGAGSNIPILTLNNTAASGQNILRFEHLGVTRGQIRSVGTASFFIENKANSDIRFGTNGTVRATITNTGNMGIGTTTPATKLQVVGGGQFGLNDTTLAVSITDSGRVGIGTLAPTSRLHVKETTSSFQYVGRFENRPTIGGAYGLTIDATSTGANWATGQYLNTQGGTSGGGAYGVQAFTYAYGTQPAYGIYSHALSGTTTGREWAFYGLGDGYFSGQVGIGTTTPATKLDVSGTVTATSFVGDGSGLTGLTASLWNPNGSNIYYDVGNVGIGTTSPVEDLHLVASSGATGNFATGSDLLIDSGASQRYITMRGPNSGQTGIAFSNSQGAVDGGVRYWPSATAGADRLELLSGTVGGINIKGSGDVGIGTTLPSYKLHVIGTAAATSHLTTSDIRWKKNVQPLESSLAKVSALRGVTFDWRRDEFNDMAFEEGTQIGLIAQEVEKVLPEIVSEDDEGYKAVAYSELTAVLIEAVKELKAEKDVLAERLEALERQMSAVTTASAE